MARRRRAKCWGPGRRRWPVRQGRLGSPWRHESRVMLTLLLPGSLASQGSTSALIPRPGLWAPPRGRCRGPHTPCPVWQQAEGRAGSVCFTQQSTPSGVASPGPFLVAALEQGCGRTSEPLDQQPSPGPRDSLCLRCKEVPVLT